MTKTWARPYLRVLKGKLSSWEDTHSPAGETRVAESVVKAIEQLRVDKEIEEDLPDNLEQASTKIKTWFRNNSGKSGKSGGASTISDEPVAPKYKKKWGIRDVVRHTMKDQVNNRAIAQGGPKGSKAFLKAYSAALTWAVEQLDDEEYNKCEDMAEDWNVSGPPTEEQARLAERKLGSTALNMIKELELSMGAQVFIAVGYRGSDGTINKAKFASTPRHGKKFTHRKGWRKDTWGFFDHYLQDQFPDEDDADDDSEVESDTIALEYDVNGYPLLPSMKDLSLEQMKQYIRLYATVIYQLFTSNKKAKVPWGALVKEEDFLEGDERIPSDPSKLRYSEAVDLWTRWKKKQDDGMVGLVFKRGLLKDLRMHTGRGRKGKRVMKQWKYVEPDDHDGSEEDELDGDGKAGEEEEGAGDARDGDSAGEEEGAGGQKGAGTEEGAGDEDGSGGEEGTDEEGGAGNAHNGGEGVSRNRDGDDEDELRDMVDDPHISSPACHSQNKKTKTKFLRGLTKEPSYLKLIKTAQSMSLDLCIWTRHLLTQFGDKSNSTWVEPPGLPEWCYWTYPREYLPAKFHTKDGYNDDIGTVFNAVKEHRQISSGILLGFGMAIREAHRCQFLEPDEPPPEDMPAYVAGSFVGQNNIIQLLDHIDSIIEMVVVGFDTAKKKKDSNEELDPGATRRSGRNRLKRTHEEGNGEDGTSAKKLKPAKPAGKAAPKLTGSKGGRRGTSSNGKK